MGRPFDFNLLLAATCAALLLGVSGCKGVEKPEAVAINETRTGTAVACSPEARMAAGGKAGVAENLLCYADAGKACSGGADCAGDCLAPRDRKSRTLQVGAKVTGQCQATSSQFGCRATVEDGRIATTWMCRD